MFNNSEKITLSYSNDKNSEAGRRSQDKNFLTHFLETFRDNDQILGYDRKPLSGRKVAFLMYTLGLSTALVLALYTGYNTYFDGSDI